MNNKQCKLFRLERNQYCSTFRINIELFTQIYIICWQANTIILVPRFRRLFKNKPSGVCFLKIKVFFSTFKRNIFLIKILANAMLRKQAGMSHVHT